MGCSNEPNVKVDDNTSQSHEDENENLTEKDFPDFEELNSKQLFE